MQNFQDKNTAISWDKDTVSANPSRPEQLDMLITLIEDGYQPGKTILDLGFGTGLVEEQIFRRIPAVQIVGVDASQAMMELAHPRLEAFKDQYVTVQHDLSQIAGLQLPERNYQFIFSVQTLHHLTDSQMQTAYGFIFSMLEAGGLFLLLDRIAVEKAALYDCYQSLWRRQDRVYGSQVAQGEGANFPEHQEIVRTRGDIPMGLERHLELLKQAGFEAACLHLQTNRALFAARKPTE
ncbi:MAG: class I SAM-dependent methyltransferase [Anaerolineae bacterium]|nr:class I SAM-dependent methyltransferase [Anaerolineae bacterium]